MSAQTYNSIQQTVAIALTQAQTPYTSFPPNFLAQFPMAVSYAEDRIYHDIPLLAERSVNSGLSIGAGSKVLSLSSVSPPFLIVEQFGVVVTGNTVWFNPISFDALNRFWPSTTMVVTPSLTTQYGLYWAMQDDHTIAIAPPTDLSYPTTVIGLAMPVAMSQSNQSTYLSINYPDMLIAGIMVYMTGALTRNFGAQADEPRSAVSWEGQYQALMAAARDEERRRRGLAPDFPTSPQPEMRRQAQ